MDNVVILVVLIILAGTLVTIYFLLEKSFPEEPTCSELNGYLCQPEECDGKLSMTSDGFCCSRECTKPIERKTCSDLKGDICSDESECEGNLLSAIDTDFCCSEKCQKPKTCAEQNGFVCSNKNQCTGSLLESSDVSLCCSGQCISPVPTPTCNVNNLCEGWESESCSDCQCPGTLCGGICHYSEGVCCGDRFLLKEEGKKIYCTQNFAPKTKLCYLPGTCDLEIPLKISFAFPFNLELNKETDGKIEVLNTGQQTASIEFNLTSRKVDVLENGVPIDYIEINDIEPGQTKSKNIKLIGREFVSKNQSSIILPQIIFSPIVDLNRRRFYTFGHTEEFLVYDPLKYTQCGDYKFSEKGECRNSAYYFDWDCSKDELTSQKCIDGIPIFFNSIYHPNEYDTYGGVRFTGDTIPAKGLVRVAFVPINTDLSQSEIAEIGQKVEQFYDRESNRILGKNMIDFDFRVYNRISLNYDPIKTEDELFSAAASSAGLRQSDYDFLIVFANKTEAKRFLVVRGDEDGHHIGKGRILATPAFITPFLVAHEIAHGFGAPDLYTNDTQPFACNFNFDSRCLMCGQKSFSKIGELDEEGLCTAGFFGWGDVDNDGIFDIDDTQIDPMPYTIPTWFNGISLEIVDSYKNVTNLGNEAWYLVKVKDNKDGLINAANVTISGGISTFSCQSRTIYNSDTIYLCGIAQHSNTPVDITLRAEFLGYSDQKIVTFVP